jgi:isopentenyl-diphosphate Delta-isomerase
MIGARGDEPTMAAGEADGDGDSLRTFEARKAQHVQVTATGDVEALLGPGWNDIALVHDALPETDLDEVDLEVEFLGKRLRAPLMIPAMTGGHALAGEINATLARAAERHGLAMGVGSQRAALRHPELAGSYEVVRQEAPTAFLVANIGAPQLIDQESGPALELAEVQQAVAMIGADALAVHFNYLEESVQPEGDRRARGCASAIARLTESSSVPVIAKETGAGLSRDVALRLRDLGIAALDVGGRGGTSFAAVEGIRAGAIGDERGRNLGRLLRSWGIPTAVSIVGATAPGLPIVATGGVRSGLDAAKALALGSTLVGVARPLLQAALEGEAALDRWLEQFLVELRTVLFLTGCRHVLDLWSRPRVITGETRQWLKQLELAGVSQ